MVMEPVQMWIVDDESFIRKNSDHRKLRGPGPPRVKASRNVTDGQETEKNPQPY